MMRVLVDGGADVNFVQPVTRESVLKLALSYRFPAEAALAMAKFLIAC
jgi:hypothetical protein